MLISSILFIICSNAVAIRRDKSILYARIAVAVLVCSFLITINSYNSQFHDKGLGLFGGLYHTTAVTHVFQMFIFIVTSLILQLNAFYARKVWNNDYSGLYNILFTKLVYYNNFILNKMAEQFRILEYPLIILFVVVGGVFLISTSDLISIFLSVELQSYGLYILCTIYRNSERATSGGLTYFLLGGLSSCFILLASGLLYGNSGNTSFDGLYVMNNISNVNDQFNQYFINNGLLQEQETYSDLNIFHPYESYYINFSLVILSIGFLFKVSAAPFHFWSPDVYDSIPTVVTTFVAIFAKISIFILLLELVHSTTNFFASQKQFVQIADNSLFNYSWTFTLLISSLLSLIVGSVLGLTQFRIKRMFAYSTISHVGFLLLALTINSIESIQSFIFYLMQYSISNLNAFILLVTIGYSLYFYVEKTPQKETGENSNSPRGLSSREKTFTGEISDKDNSPVQLVNQLKGYFYINPFLALSLAITIFSFVGVPPLIGFFAKQNVLSSALDNGYVFMALVAILTSVISACYYLALIKQMFFDKTDYILNPVLKNITVKANIVNKITNRVVKHTTIKIENIVLSTSLTTTISILTLTILFFILNPQEWLNLANILALILFNC